MSVRSSWMLVQVAVPLRVCGQGGSIAQNLRIAPTPHPPGPGSQTPQTDQGEIPEKWGRGLGEFDKKWMSFDKKWAQGPQIFYPGAHPFNPGAPQRRRASFG